MEARQCHNCSGHVGLESQLYVLKIEMYASPEVILPSQEPGSDPMVEMQALLDQMETLEIEEATDQVYEIYKYQLCPACRKKFHIQLKQAREVGFGI